MVTEIFYSTHFIHITRNGVTRIYWNTHARFVRVVSVVSPELIPYLVH